MVFFNFISFSKSFFKSFFVVRLFVKGVGYKILRSRSSLLNNIFRFELGYSVVYYVSVPQFLFCRHRRDRVIIFGTVKDSVVRLSKCFINLRFPDVYKGKGVRDAAYIFQPKPGKQRLFLLYCIMPVFIGKSQILFSFKKGSFFFYFSSIFGINKTTSLWVLAHIGLPVSCSYLSVYTSGPASREHIINKLFASYRNVPYFVFGRELKHLRFIRRKKFLSSTLKRALRMKAGLPIWGQKTRSNARTAGRRVLFVFFLLWVVV